MPETRSLPTPDGLAGERVDVGISRLLGLSRSRAAELAAAGCVRVSGRSVGKSDRLEAGAWLEVEIPDPPARRAPQEVPDMAIRYQDEDLVVIDKPVGVAAHPSPGWEGPTVTEGLAAAGVSLAPLGPAERQGIVHRLDVGTSGLMVVAKSPHAYTELKRQFKQREVDKIYHALVQGHPDPSEGTVDAPIGRRPGKDNRFGVMTDGKPSVTHYRTMEAFRYGSLLRIRLETGRTHQIRVHMAAVRHPCIGDLTYGADPALAGRLGLKRQWLHAQELAFTHPSTGAKVRYSSQYPQDLAVALERISD